MPTRTEDPTIFDMVMRMAKPQRECPLCHYRHNHAGVVCDLCKRFQPALHSAWMREHVVDTQGLAVNTSCALPTPIPSAAVALPQPPQEEPPMEPSTSPVIDAPQSIGSANPTPTGVGLLMMPAPPQIVRYAKLEPGETLTTNIIASTALDTSIVSIPGGFTSSVVPSPRLAPRKNAHICRICQHESLPAIDAAILAETMSGRRIAIHYHVSARQISQHRLNCLKLPPHTKREAAEIGGKTSAQERMCKICRHPSVETIDAALVAGTPASVLERQYAETAYHFSDKAIATHRKRCLGLPSPPRGNHSGKIRGLAAAKAREKVVADTAPAFAQYVAAEIARLTTERDTLEIDCAALTARLSHIERQHTALRAYEETLREDEVSSGY